MYTQEVVKEDRPELWAEYRTLYKDIYGRYPVDLFWSSLTEFKEDLSELRAVLGEEEEDPEEDLYTMAIDDPFADDDFYESFGRRKPVRYDDDWE